MKQFLKLKETSQYKKAVGAQSYTKENLDATQKIRLEVLSTSVSDMEKIIRDNGLEEVYNTLDKSKLPQPVSFDFKLLKLRIQNLRSIEDATITFGEGNTVTALTGSTGSGKSSILQGLIFALRGDPHLAKYNRKLPTGDTLSLRVELELVYNFKLYYIVRSSDGTRQFSIGDKENVVPSSSLKTFNEFVFNELPFIKCLDFFIVSPNTHYFEAVDRVELFKTVFNLDIFNSLYVQAKTKYSEYSKKVHELEKIKLSEESRNSALNSQKSTILDSLGANSRFLENLDVFVENLQKIKDLNNQIMAISGNLSVTTSRYEINSDRLGDLKQYSKDDVEKKLGLLQSIDSYNSAMDECYRNERLYEEQVTHYESTLKNLTDSSLYCPNCHSLVSADKKYAELRLNYESKLEDAKKSLTSIRELIRNNINSAQSFIAINSDYIGYDEDCKMFSKLDKNFYEYKTILDSLLGMGELIRDTNDIEKNLKEMSSDLESKKIEYESILGTKDYNAYCNELSEYIRQGSVVKEYQKLLGKLKNDIQESDKRLQNSVDDYNKAMDSNNKIKNFMDMFDFNNMNSVPYILIDKILKTINTNDMVFSSKKTLKSGDERFHINCAVRIKGLFVDYDEASDGQKTIMDLFILNRVISLFNGVGVLIMDECLSNIDDQLYSRVKEFFDSTPCHDVLVVSHNPNFEGATRTIRCTLGEDGVTSIEVGK